MSKIHILAGSGLGVYTAIVHIPTPTGSNSAGVLWTDVVKNSGRTKTIMSVGIGPGQITQSEVDQMVAGTLIEGSFQWQDDPNLSAAARTADLDLRATQLTNELLARYAVELKYFGVTRS